MSLNTRWNHFRSSLHIHSLQPTDPAIRAMPVSVLKLFQLKFNHPNKTGWKIQVIKHIIVLINHIYQQLHSIWLQNVHSLKKKTPKCFGVRHHAQTASDTKEYKQQYINCEAQCQVLGYLKF